MNKANIVDAYRRFIRLVKKVKNYVAERPALKIAFGAMLLLAAAYLYRVINPRRIRHSITIKPLPMLLADLKANKIGEALFRGSWLYYLSSNLFRTDVSDFPK